MKIRAAIAAACFAWLSRGTCQAQVQPSLYPSATEAPFEALGTLDLRADPAIPVLKQTGFPISYVPGGLETGPDGNLWFTTSTPDTTGNRAVWIGNFGRLNPWTGERLENRLSGDFRLFGVGSAAGRLWFGVAKDTGNSKEPSGYLGSQMTDGGSPAFTLLDQNYPSQFTAGPDENAWFTVEGFFTFATGRTGQVGVYSADVSGSLKRHISVPRGGPSDPGGGHIVTGPDLALWFTEPRANRVGRLTTSDALTEFNLPTPKSGPNGIAVGSDGALWFTESGASAIGRISTSGDIREFPIPSGGIGGAIATGPDGAVWFRKENSLVRVVARGDQSAPEFQEFSSPHLPGFGSSSERAATLVVGPDGNLWYGAALRPCAPNPATLPFGDCGELIRVEIQPCPPGPDLCLDGRFRARVEWKVEGQSSSQQAVPVPKTPNFGYFWFFSPGNVELALKIVDGRFVNGHMWIFAASLTNVAFDVTVTDTLTGRTMTYSNPAGQLASFVDTTTF